MASGSTRPAQLGADDVVRFLDCAHFLHELAGNLGRGRALVRTRRSFELGDRLTVEIEAPGVPWRVEVDVLVVFARSGFVGLELEHFDEALSALDRLGEAAERADGEVEPSATDDLPRGGLLANAEKTVVSPNPVLTSALFPPLGAPPRTGAAEVHIHEEDEAETGEFPILPGMPIPDPAETHADERGGQRAPDLRGATIMEAATTGVAIPSAQTGRRRRPRPETPHDRPSATIGTSQPPEHGQDEALDVQHHPTEQIPAARPDGPPSHDVFIPPSRALGPSDDEAKAPSNGALGLPKIGAHSDDDHEAELSDAFDGDEETRGEVAVDEPAEDHRAANAPIEREDHAASVAEARVESISAYEVPPPELGGSAIMMNPLLTAEDAGTPEVYALLDEGLVASADEAATGSVDALDVTRDAQPALPSTDDLVEDQPSPVVEAAPSMPLDNVDALDDRDLTLPRVTRGGVVRVRDAADLLGLYLAQIRHGTLTLLGDLAGEAGDTVTLKLAGSTVATVEGLFMARVGPWVTVAIPDASAIEQVLKDDVDAWRVAIDGLAQRYFEEREEQSRDAAEAPVAVAPPEPPPPAEAPSASEPPDAADEARASDEGGASEKTGSSDEPSVSAKSGASAPPSPIEQPDATEAPAIAEDAPSEAPEPAKATLDLRKGTPGRGPKTPKLIGDVVDFPATMDLEHELRANLANAGLFVESDPIPIRERRRLKVSVDGKPTGVTIEADVVFANSGKVGFSVPAAAEAQAALEQFLVSGLPVDVTPTPDPSQTPMPSDSSSTGDVDSFVGRFEGPLSIAQILGFEHKRISGHAGLARTSALQLIEYIVRNGHKGILEVKSKTLEQTIWWHGGSVAYIQSEPFEDSTSLGRVLISQKKLNDAALRDGLEKAKATNKPLGRTLVLLGAIRKSELTGALREQARLKLDQTFAFESGSFSFGAWREPPGDADLVLTKGLGLLARYLRHRYDEYNYSELEVIFGANMNRRVRHETDFESIATSLQLQPKELRFLELSLDGQRTIHDAVLGSPAGRLGSLRLVGMCLSMGLIRFTDGDAIRREKTSVGREPSAFVRVNKDLDERLALFHGMNHFEVLGVHWSAHHRNYRSAYEEAKREFNLRRDPYKDAPEEVLRKVKAVLAILEESYKTLSDPASRGMYRKQLFDKTERQYAAEMLVKQGEVALMRGDRVGAIESLETAVELDPSARNRNLLMSAREGRR